MTSLFFVGHALFTITACAAICAWQFKHAARILDESRKRQLTEQAQAEAAAGVTEELGPFYAAPDARRTA